MGVEEFESGGVNLRGLFWRTLLPVIIATARLSPYSDKSDHSLR